MTKKNPEADNNQPKNKKKMPEKDNLTPKNLPPKEDMPLNQGKENKNQTPSSRRNKPGQQQSECKDPKQVLGRIPDEYDGNDENVVPEQGLGRIPDEYKEDVEEK